MTNRLGGATREIRALFELGGAAGLTDGQLLERFATRADGSGDLAFEALVDRHGPMVLRACRSVVRDDHEAMDAFQATFLVLARKARTLWVVESIAPWLHRVARRAAGKARLAAVRRRDLERRLGAGAGRAAADRPGEAAEIARVVHEAVDRLPERYRVPIILCDLEGRTCEEAARHLDCPVGTVGSRLVRGRARLRDHLIRRGLAPSLAFGLLETGRASAAGVPPALRAATGRVLGFRTIHPQATAGVSSTAVAPVAEDVRRSLLMDQFRTLAAGLAVASGVALAAAGTLYASGGNRQDPDPPVAKKPEPQPAFDKAERYKDYAMATVGNMRPSTDPADRFRSVAREAILYKDGTVKLYEIDAKDPVVPAIRHVRPIREMNIMDESGLLITSSDDQVKVWDGLTGQPRKVIEGRFARPLFFARDHGAGRFATVDNDGRVVTLWDTRTIEPAVTIRPEGTTRILGAGLSGDGRVLATIGEDQIVTLRDSARGKPFATIQAPSPLATRCFVDDKLIGSHLQLDDRFWEGVGPLMPSPPSGDK